MQLHVRADCAAMLDIRLNAYRNCQKQGWASSAEAFPVVVGEGAVFCFGTICVFCFATFFVGLRSVFAAESLMFGRALNSTGGRVFAGGQVGVFVIYCSLCTVLLSLCRSVKVIFPFILF